jgi:DNA-binding NarL/FixJ family response regulator
VRFLMIKPGQNSTPEQTFSPENIRVLIVDDQDYMRKALRRLLEVQPSFNVCGEACDGVEAVEKAMELKPQVVVMDIHMPNLDGLEATRRILRKQSDIEILIFTQYELSQASQAAENAGARGCVSKSEAAHQLVPAVRSVCEHRPYFPSA